MNNKNRKPDLEQHIEMLLRSMQDQLSVGEWPKKADRLLQEIASSSLDTGTFEEEFLSIVINDALDGVDVSQKYPTFFQMLLQSPRLQEAFQDGLIQIAADDKVSQPAFIEEGSSLPDGLLDSTTTVDAQQKPVGGWIAAWSLTAEKLQTAIDALWAKPSLAYRSGGTPLETSRVTLLRREAAPGGEIEVLLEASYKPQTPEHVFLSLWTARDEAGQAPPELVVELQWGRYMQELYLQEWGEVSLPPLAVDEIVTPQGRLKATSLYLRIAAVS